MTHYPENCSRNITTSTVGLTDSLMQIPGRWLNQQRLKAGIQRERASLLSMSDAQLRDIGVDRSAAVLEASRSDIPAARSR